MQRTIVEMETKLKSESSRLKKKYESENQDLIIQIDNLNRTNADLAKANKSLATKLKVNSTACCHLVNMWRFCVKENYRNEADRETDNRKQKLRAENELIVCYFTTLFPCLISATCRTSFRHRTYSLIAHRSTSSLFNFPLTLAPHTQARREGGVFPGPATFWGPRHRSKILKKVLKIASFRPKM